MGPEPKFVSFKSWDCHVKFGQYANGRIAIRLVGAHDGEPIATATVNVPEISVEHGNVLVKDYSENEGMLDALVHAGIVSPPVKEWYAEYVEFYECKLLVYPEFAS